MVRVSISGWYGHGNVGDEAILEGILKTLSDISMDIVVTVFSDNPQHTRRLHRVKSVNQNSTLRQPTEIARGLWTYWSTDLFILGGGGFLSDWQYPSVPKLWLRRAWRAKMLGRKTMAYGIGAGPITTTEGCHWTQSMMSKLDLVTVRDDASKEWLRRAGVKSPIYVTGDPALRLRLPNNAETTKLLRTHASEMEKPIVAISLAPWFHIDRLFEGAKSRYRRLVNDAASVMRYMRTRLDLSILMIPMHQRIDIPFNREVIRASGIRDGIRVVGEQLTPSEVVGLYRGTEFLITNRLHSVILASLCGIPSIGVVIHHKTRSFLESLGLEELSVPLGDGRLEENVDLDVGRIKSSIGYVIENKEELRAQILSRLETLRQRERLNARLCTYLLRDELELAKEIKNEFTRH
ncbi:MAG: polysaccharide pyruvyl transferase family protein [Thermoplasmata archaeon]